MTRAPSATDSARGSRTQFAALRARVRTRWQATRLVLAARLDPTRTPVSDAGVPATELDPESALWVHAHRNNLADPTVPPSTAMVLADASVQTWMGKTLTSLGWTVIEPVLLAEGWVPARGENLGTGQPVTTHTTPSKTSAYARSTDPDTAKRAGAAAAAASHSITVNSHQGQLLLAYLRQHQEHPGVGFTAAEAVQAADLLTDGATGSPWRRVTDLRDLGLLTYLLDGTGARVVRKNDSNSDGQVLVVTPLGLRAASALVALADHDFLDYPLVFDGYAEPTLFEDLAQTLARIDTSPGDAESTTA